MADPPTRRDPESNEPLGPRHLTRAELRAHLAEMRRRWEAWAFGPKPEGEWSMTAIGWVRSKAK